MSLLLEDGRISFAEIGRRVGLSLPAASERVKRLEEAGIITGYKATLNFKKLGYPTIVFVQLTISPRQYETIKAVMAEIPEIIEAHHVAGDLSFILKLRLADLEDLEPILTQLNRDGGSKSIIVLSTALESDGGRLISVTNDQ